VQISNFISFHFISFHFNLIQSIWNIQSNSYPQILVKSHVSISSDLLIFWSSDLHITILDLKIKKCLSFIDHQIEYEHLTNAKMLSSIIIIFWLLRSNPTRRSCPCLQTTKLNRTLHLFCKYSFCYYQEVCLVTLSISSTIDHWQAYIPDDQQGKKIESVCEFN
jgi:hypothetical protein